MVKYKKHLVSLKIFFVQNYQKSKTEKVVTDIFKEETVSLKYYNNYQTVKYYLFLTHLLSVIL